MMMPNGSLQGELNGHHQEGFPALAVDEEEPVINNNPTEISKWAREAVKLMGNGELEEALHYMNLCLDERFRTKILVELSNSTNSEQSTSKLNEDYKLSASDEIILLEKRCLVQMKLKMYGKVWGDASRILEKRSNHTVAYKCLLASLCKTDKFSQVSEVLKIWKTCAPNDLDMIEARTKIEGLLSAVRNGIDPINAFSNVEELLGLNNDWLLGKKISDPQWKYRPVPPGANTFVLCLQYRFGHCSLGEKCPDAHGEQELEEWKLRYSISNISSMLECSRLDPEATYIKSIMDTLSQLEDEKTFLAEELPGVTVTCSESKTQLQACTLKTHSWEFIVDSSRPLCHICLLYEVHRPYFKIGSALFNGHTNTLNLKTGRVSSEPSLQVLEVSVNPAALALTGSSPDSFIYTIEIICSPDVFGTFRQTVLFDFGGVPKLIKEISVEVVPSSDEDAEQSSTITSKRKVKIEKKSGSFGSNLRTRSTWNFGNADLVDSITGDKVKSEKVGFALMTSPTLKKKEIDIDENPDYQYLLNKENYRDRMRFFLTQEERARQSILSKYNISAHLTILGHHDVKSGVNEGTRYAVDGNLFGKMILFRDISEDTPVGRLILRSCNSVLLSKTENIRKSEVNETKPRVYLCKISEKTKNAMYFEIGCHCVEELNLTVSEVSAFDVQFQLDRTALMEQKRVIDEISQMHLDLLFPDFTKDFSIPWNPVMQWNPSLKSESFRLNPKQKEAFNAVTANTTRTPPILIIGPFGTGKTFTLVQCIKKVLEDENSRIMICTHSNSAADLYIKEYLDGMVKAGNKSARPLRIYYTERSKLTVQREVRSYCLFDEMDNFRRPEREEVLKHRIIVVTLATSYMLIELNLPSDTFSHILLDEAAQAMESEAITPLLAAGENTKIVLAGDHMQLSPELFSDDAKHFHSSLLERLHCLYPDSHPCKLMLCEIYRSHSAIIKFASDSFYQNKLECGMIQPPHNDYYPLTFFAARGEDVQEAESTSYYNMAEVFELSEKVEELIKSWPTDKWGDVKRDNQIGVLTPYPDQVNRIRQRLRKKGYYYVSVERVLNVQGKQFRAVFLSTVRTHKPWVRILPESIGNEVDMGFFSNPKLLNTALTRAQSLVAVVGDPVSLCSLGKCRRLWKDFINICNENNSLHGMTHVQINQNIIGVELRLTWGLNPLANEYVPKSSPLDSSVSLLDLDSRNKGALPTSMMQTVKASSEAAVSRTPSLQHSNSTTRLNHLPNVWQNMNMQKFIPGFTQLHQQGQMPLPMIPVPILMNPQQPSFTAGPGGLAPNPFIPPFSMMQRPPMGFPPMGPRYIAVPLHHRATSAFAQYRPPPDHKTSGGPSGTMEWSGMGYSPSPLMPPPKIPPPHPSPSILGQGHGQNPMGQAPLDKKNIWGQPLYRPNEYSSGPLMSQPPSQGYAEQRPTGNFLMQQPSSWPSLSQRPPAPTNTPHLSTFRIQQTPSYQQHPPKPPTRYPPLVSTTSTVSKSQNFSAEEILYLKRVLDDYSATSTLGSDGQLSTCLQPDEAIQSIQTKLAHAVSRINENSQSNNQNLIPNQQLHYPTTPGFAFNNNCHPYMTNPMSVPPSTQSVSSDHMRTYHPPAYPSPIVQSEGGVNRMPAPASAQYYGSGNLQMDSGQQSSHRQTNPWAGRIGSSEIMNGVVVNGMTSGSMVRKPNTNKSNSMLKTEAELTVGWMRSHSASNSTNPSAYHQEEEEPYGTNTSLGFGRSYASAVKQPVIQQNSLSPTLPVEGGGDRSKTPEKLCQVSIPPQPKPLMEMDVDFPFPSNYTPPPRLRNSNTPPRFRTNVKKGKKKK